MTFVCRRAAAAVQEEQEARCESAVKEAHTVVAEAIAEDALERFHTADAPARELAALRDVTRAHVISSLVV